MSETRKRKTPRPMMGFPWPASYIKAFQSLAERIPTGKARGNASALARTILEQFMFAVLEFEETEKFGLLNPWDAEEGQIPRPSILRYAVKKYDERQAAPSEGHPVRKSRSGNGHATLPS